jgi:hypothetical protein
LLVDYSELRYVACMLPPAQCAHDIILWPADLFCNNSSISFCSKEHRYPICSFPKEVFINQHV